MCRAPTTLLYTWNARDQLVSLSGPSVTASFAYDAVGRRRQKTVNGVTTTFLYDGLDVVQELDGTTPVANLLTGPGIDEVLTRTDAVGAQGFLTDGLGSILALTDPAGSVLTEYTYEPFGKTTISGAASTNAFKYTGREDDGTGLYYYRARYYHPGLQRFLSQDPIGFAGRDVNLYGYVAQNPISHIDPFGWWYIDVNGSWGSPTGGGITVGVFFGPDGVHPYVGGGIFLPPGLGGAINWSPGSPSPGRWSWQLGGALGPGGAFGADECGNQFWEVGVGTPGGGLSWYYTF